jgi:sugar phosphate isomerase/epimerase
LKSARLRIGVRLESIGLPLRQGLLAAQKLGVAGVQVSAVGDLSPRALSQTGRREFKNLLRSHNLELAALYCPLRRGLESPQNQEGRIEHVKSVMSLSFELASGLTTIEFGRLSASADSPGASWLAEALLALGQHGDRIGATLCLESGMDPGQTLAEYLGRFDSGALAINLDPANWVMGGLDPLAQTQALSGKVKHVVARDARRSAGSGEAQEVALGNGDIEWIGFLGLLEEQGYRGWLTVDRRSGDQRPADVAAGVAFLRRLGVGALSGQ